jgi:LPXTG-motif cell wall-anchored protein
MNNNTWLMVAVLSMFLMATLYVMRRRTRMGKRTPKF